MKLSVKSISLSATDIREVLDEPVKSSGNLLVKLKCVSLDLIGFNSIELLAVGDLSGEKVELRRLS